MPDPKELTAVIEDLRLQVAALSERIARLEPKTAASPAVPPPPRPAGITEEQLLAVAGAVAAYLGVRVHIKQIRLVSSRAWAQEGRVSVQASHRLHS